jgi:hypothetical protein
MLARDATVAIDEFDGAGGGEDDVMALCSC